jgi:hypothetical protein
MNDFAHALEQIPLQWRCYQTATGQFQSYPPHFCFVGVPADQQFGRVPLEQMPSAPPGISFLAGAEQAPLIDAFIRSPYVDTIERLHIGASSYAYGTEKSLDYADAITLLSDSAMPQLTTLRLGVWDLFCNAHCAYGRLGDLTRPLAALAAVKTLELYGYFELSRPLPLLQLEDLFIESNDPMTWINGGSLTNRTFQYLLTSDLPALEEATLIFLECDAEQPPCYTFPDSFLRGDNVPQLRRFEIDATALAPGEDERLLSSKLAQRPGIRIYLNYEH